MPPKICSHYLGISLALGLSVLLSGCSSSVGNTQLLHGTWQATDADVRLTLSFRSDGSLIYRAQAQNAWVNTLSGPIEAQGRWRLKHDQLVIEFQTTPAQVAWLGGSWQGSTNTVQIQKLTADELRFVGSKTVYRKSLAP